MSDFINNTNIWQLTLFILLFLVLSVIFCLYFNNSHQIQTNLNVTNSNNSIETFTDGYITDKGLLPDGKYVIRGSRNNRFCTDDANGIICIADTPGPREIFTFQHLGGEQYAIQGQRSGLWASLTTTGIRCDNPVVSDAQVFNIHSLGKGIYGIQSNRNKNFCVDSGYGMVCDTTSMYNEGFQKFEIIPIHFNNIK